MSEFHEFATAVHRRFTALSAYELYTVDVDRDEAFAKYLSFFPEGTNPIYRVRTEHDCACCRNFIRNVGTVVALADGRVQSVWRVLANEPYNTVAAAMDEWVLSKAPKSIFRTDMRSFGAESSLERQEDGVVKTWNHFHGKVADKHFSSSPAADIGEFNACFEVLQRSLKELSIQSVVDVIELAETKDALYRGEEHLPALREFQRLQVECSALDSNQKRVAFALQNAAGFVGRMRFRNTAIGKLVQAFSDGDDLEASVKLFEKAVAPENYNRTTAIITPGMVKDAMKTIATLELEPALERRLACIQDISVNNVLWVDNAARVLMKGGLESILSAATAKSGFTDPNAVDVDIETFMKEFLPRAREIDMHVSNAHLTNFVTLTAPVHADAGKLFKWDNGFAWSYDGNVTDSIREKVKRAGGNVDAKLRFSLSWFNYDDLDIHVRTPEGRHIFFANKHDVLDVDMNAGGARSREPVENLAFAEPRDGVYELWVNQYARRETTDVGFEIEVENAGVVKQLTYKKGVLQGDNIVVGRFTVKNGQIVGADFGADIVAGSGPVEKWGIKTMEPVRVTTVMFSPNYWDGNAVGNKHWLFMLDGCRVDSPARGIYNEFLSSELLKHRKVFEVLGGKTKCPVVPDQLSGLGFSSTRGDTVMVTVKSDRGNRRFNIEF
jgi:hypothetical protein